MAMRFLIFNILLTFLLSAPVMAADGPPPLNFKGYYEFHFGGVPFGRMGIEIEQSADHYAITSDIAATGIVKLFTKHSSHTTAEATDGDIIYESRYRTRGKRRAVTIIYTGGKVVKTVLVPPESADKRPDIPDKLKNAAVDLLTLNLKLREHVWNGLHGGDREFSLTTFDGRRLTQVNGSVADRKILIINGQKVPVVRVPIRRKLLGGFTASELADYDPKEPTLWLYYSDDEKLIPVKVEVGFLFGRITGTLVKECGSGESCLLGLKE